MPAHHQHRTSRSATPSAARPDLRPPDLHAGHIAVEVVLAKALLGDEDAVAIADECAHAGLLDAGQARLVELIRWAVPLAGDVTWCGPGPFDMAGGPTVAQLLATALLSDGNPDAEHDVMQLLAEPFDDEQAVVAEQARRRHDEEHLRQALVAAACSAEAGRDPRRIADELRHRLEQIAVAA